MIDVMRVFPRRTKATPTDSMVCIGFPSIIELITPWQEAYISVTFSWDIPAAEKIAGAGRCVRMSRDTGRGKQ